MQHSLKLGGSNYHFKWVKVPGTAHDRKCDITQWLYISRDLQSLTWKSCFPLKICQCI